MPTILDLIANGTLSAEMAATLWAAVDARLSFVVVAIPRLAGKTTVSNAMLSLLPPDVPVHRLSGDESEMARLQQAAPLKRGYLVVGEFSPAPVPTYIWGRPVRRVFDTLEAGYSIATALHASGLQDAFDKICLGNGVTDAQASHINLMLYIRVFGYRYDSLIRRLAEVHEIDRVENGQPVGRLLHRWVQQHDRFEPVEQPRLLHSTPAELQTWAALLREMALSGYTSPADVARLVADHRSW